MEVLEWIAQYWVGWVCALIAGGIAIFAKHYIKIEKESLEKKWQEKEKNMCGKIICTFEDKIKEVEEKSKEEDKIIHNELDQIHTEVDTIESGILSIQGKQFREMCEDLLKQDYITVEEYEEFEEEYAVYKSLGGNHRGDALHERVVIKVDKQKSKPEDK